MVIDVLRHSHVWENLKNIIKNKRLVEDIGEQFSLRLPVVCALNP